MSVMASDWQPALLLHTNILSFEYVWPKRGTSWWEAKHHKGFNFSVARSSVLLLDELVVPEDGRSYLLINTRDGYHLEQHEILERKGNWFKCADGVRLMQHADHYAVLDFESYSTIVEYRLRL